jgi:hypothetical protein
MLRWLLHRLSLSLLLLLLWRRHGSYPSAQPAHVACMERSRWVGWVSKPRGIRATACPVKCSPACSGSKNLELGLAKLGEFCKPTSN